MTGGALPPWPPGDEALVAVVREAGGLAKLPIDGAHLVHRHSAAVVALEDAELVLRVAAHTEAAVARARVAVAVTRWLADNGFPCTVPSRALEQPLPIQGHVVSIWRLEHLAPGPAATCAELGAILRQLHDRPEPPLSLPALGDPFGSVVRAIDRAVVDVTSASGRGAPNHLQTDLRWLKAHVGEVRSRWASLRFTRPIGLIHGDAHPGNLMRRGDGSLVLGDWDHAARGPREWDLAQAHYTHRRFRYPDDIDALADAYGWDIREWDGLPAVIAARELTGLSPYIRAAATDAARRDELVHRIATLKDGDRHARWHRPGELDTR